MIYAEFKEFLHLLVSKERSEVPLNPIDQKRLTELLEKFGSHIKGNIDAFSNDVNLT